MSRSKGPTFKREHNQTRQPLGQHSGEHVYDKFYITRHLFDKYKSVENRMAEETGNTGLNNKGYPYVMTYSDLDQVPH